MSGVDTGQRIRRVTWVGFVANMLLAALKISAGWLGGSRAVLADGVHSLSDGATDVAILVGSRFWLAPADENHPHGHRRLETLVTLGIGLFLAVVAGGIVVDAVGALREPGGTSPEPIAAIAAAVSILVKESLYRWTAREGRRVRSTALVANAWHHRSDAFSSLPALISVVAAIVMPRWAFVDFVGALVISAFVLHSAWIIVAPAVAQLIDRGAGSEVETQLQTIAESTTGVHNTHALRTRYLGGGLAVDLHVRVDGACSVREGHDIAHDVRRRLEESEHDVVDVVVHIEPS